MEPTQSPTRGRAPHQARKSIAHMPASDVNIEKENLTIDFVANGNTAVQAKVATKKSRSKSIGPGGVDALKEDAGNRRQSAAVPLIKSILKPTIPLSPPKQIPPRFGSRRTSPNKPKSKLTPEKLRDNSSLDKSSWKSSNPTDMSNTSPGPFDGPNQSSSVQSDISSPSQRRTRVAVRTEEEQQAAAKERERQEALSSKDARRKSLANRRVSFAPEATLHTWDVVELPEDSTTSSASTNLTRRASSLSAGAASPRVQSRSPLGSSDPSEPPSTPPKQADEIQVAVSPVPQRDLHRKKRRRSSAIPPMNFNNPDDFSSSPASGESIVDDLEDQAAVTIDEDEKSSISDDHDTVEDDSTVAEVDADDATAHSNDSFSTGSSGRLEEALRQAAEQAGTQGIDFDENGDISMEMAGDEVTAAFKPWIKNGNHMSQTVKNASAVQDENLNPFSPAFKAGVTGPVSMEENEKNMEFTQAVGSILSPPEKNRISPKTRQRRSSVAGNRRSSGASSEDGSVLDDETMELTTAIGSIQAIAQANEAQSNHDPGSSDEAEQLTMEFTSVVGGLIGTTDRGNSMNEVAVKSGHKDQHFLRAKSYENKENSFSGEDMDMTVPAGGILWPIAEQTEPLEDQTMEMDITATMGAILPHEQSTINISQAESMPMKGDMEPLSRAQPHSSLARSPRYSDRVATMASETGSPSLITSQKRTTTKKAPFQRQSTTPRLEPRQPSPIKKPATPSKQLTPKLTRPGTPEKITPSKNVATSIGSPKKLFATETKPGDITPKPLNSNLLFDQNESSGEIVPNVILKPRTRRFSGLGVDKEGLGSPRVTALLDRRRSIGDDAKTFTLHDQVLRAVKFEDPRTLKDELENQRVEDERRESGRGILQKEADSPDLEIEKDVTSNLKDMIESLTPKKKKLNGRKSLHVGAAKGLLGKRPAELDEDEEDEDLTPKRLKGREGSPVKKVRLPAHPPKPVAIGRVTRSTRRSLLETNEDDNIRTPKNSLSPAKKTCITTPNDQPRFRDAEIVSSAAKAPASFEDKLAGAVQPAAPSDKEDRIHLQDFLNMTSIRFMELTTTKRRLTVAPSNIGESETSENSEERKLSADEKDSELENSVIAGACTIPMLELYQHSCRELKKYIAEGRSIVREIEVDTYEENPPLFREYMLAPQDIKPVMDNQFKNVKTHARLLSKAMWYEWRMKLLEGLKEGLLKISEGMDEDDQIIKQQENMIEPVLPDVIQQHELLDSERQVLQSQADELASYDQDELQDARNRLISIEDELQTKNKMLKELQSELRRQEDGIEYAVEHQQQCLAKIREAEKVCQDCRGWNDMEVATLQANVEALEKANGWTIISAAGSSLTVSYKRTLQLFFSPASFIQSAADSSHSTTLENSPISLIYVADIHEYRPQPLSTEKRFFLQIIRAQLQCLPQNRTKIKDLLNFVSSSWDRASSIAEEARMLGISYITESTILSDERMKISSILLLRDMRTKVEVAFEVTVKPDDKSLVPHVMIRPSASVIYGEEMKEKKMVEFLEQGIRGKGLGRTAGDSRSGIWARTVRALEEKLIARGKK